MLSRRARLPCVTAEGFGIRYEIIGLGTPEVTATAAVLNATGGEAARYDIGTDIRERQRGEDRPFTWAERLFDILVGSYKHNPLRRNWAGSDLGGGGRIFPGGIGNVTVPCTDTVDCISKRHDIRFWLSANFQPNCEVRIQTEKGVEIFIVKRRNIINRQAITEYIRAMLTSRSQA
jgi:hypothetical protein